MDNDLIRALKVGKGYTHDEAIDEFQRLQEVWDEDPENLESELYILGLEPDYIELFW